MTNLCTNLFIEKPAFLKFLEFYLEFWEKKNWITKYHPYGWVQWYCDFYDGKRSSDDERQIDRWIKTAGPKSRWRRRLINLLREKKLM